MGSSSSLLPLATSQVREAIQVRKNGDGLFDAGLGASCHFQCLLKASVLAPMHYFPSTAQDQDWFCCKTCSSIANVSISAQSLGSSISCGGFGSRRNPSGATDSCWSSRLGSRLTDSWHRMWEKPVAAHWHLDVLIEGRPEVRLPTKWTDEKQRWEESEKKVRRESQSREEKKKKINEEKVRESKKRRIQVREKVD